MTRILILGTDHQTLTAAVADELLKSGIVLVMHPADEELVANTVQIVSGEDLYEGEVGRVNSGFKWISMDEAKELFPAHPPDRQLHTMKPAPVQFTRFGKEKAQWKRERKGRR